MDNGFAIKPRLGVQQYTRRDSAPKRDAIETELDATRSVAAAGDSGDEPHERRSGPHDVAVDPESCEVINRENDIRAQEQPREHPDQALLRFRAYRPTLPADADTEHPHNEAHANIKA
jgi:hypothetical protein